MIATMPFANWCLHSFAAAAAPPSSASEDALTPSYSMRATMPFAN